MAGQKPLDSSAMSRKEDRMDDHSKTKKPAEIQINAGDDIRRGKYNNMIAAYSADEFILDG